MNYDDSLNPPDELIVCEECLATKREGHACPTCRLQAAIDQAEEAYEMRFSGQ